MAVGSCCASLLYNGLITLILLASAASAIDLSVGGLTYSFTSTQKLEISFPYTIYWKYISSKNDTTNTNTTRIQFGVQATPPDMGWVALGFNANGKMYPSRALVAQKASIDAPPALQEFMLTSHSMADIKPLSTVTVQDMNVEYTGDTVKFVFTVPVDIEPTIQVNGKTGIIYTTGRVTSDGMSPHGEARAAMLELSSGIVNGQPQSNAWANRQALISLHAITLALAWMLLAPLGMMFGAPSLRRKFFPKNIHSNPKHMSAHRMIGLFVVMLTAVGCFIGLYFIGSGASKLHLYMAYGVLGGLSVQTLLGILRGFANPGKKAASVSWMTRNRHTVTFIHRWLGRAMWAIAAANIFIGLRVADLSRTYFYVAGVGVFVGLLFMFMGEAVRSG